MTQSHRQNDLFGGSILGSNTCRLLIKDILIVHKDMKAALAIIVALVASAGYFLLKDSYSGVPYFYTCNTSKSEGFPCYAWPVNGTFLVLEYYAASRITGTISSAQFIAQSIWNVIPKHPLIVNDFNIAVAYAKDSTDATRQFFLLVNGTKWPFLGGGNQTSSWGILSDKILYTTTEYLNNYRDGYYLPSTY